MRPGSLRDAVVPVLLCHLSVLRSYAYFSESEHDAGRECPEVKTCAGVETLHRRIAGIEADCLKIEHSHSIHCHRALADSLCRDLVVVVTGFIFCCLVCACIEIDHRA